MDWEEGLEDLFGIAYDDLPNGMIGITPTVPEIKAFIRTTLTMESTKGYNRGYEDAEKQGTDSIAG